MVTLTPLALQNAPLLRVLRDDVDHARMQDLPKVLGRDKSNVRKSVLSLEAEGLLTTPQALGGIIELTQEGRDVLAALDRAEGESAIDATPGLAPRAGVESMIAHSLIVPDPLNPRKHFDQEALVELAASIEAEGQLQNLVVRPAGPLDGHEGDVHRLVAGERRWRAMRLLIEEGRWPADAQARCLVLDVDERAHARIALIENLKRQDLRPLEEARGFQTLIDHHGYNTDTIAEEVKFTQRFVQQRLQLLQLTPADQKLLEDGAISIEEARRRIAERNRLTLNLPPAELMLLAEITAHMAKNGKTTGYMNRTVEIADGGTSPELEALVKAGLIYVRRRDRDTARSYLSLAWQTDTKVEVTLPDFKGASRAACLRRLRAAVLGEDQADALAKSKTWSADFMNGPFEIPEDAKADIAKREAEEETRRKQAADRQEFERQTEASKRAAVDKVQAYAAEWVLNPIVGDFQEIAERLGHPLPYWQDPDSHRTYDANGADFSLFEYYGWAGREHMRRLMVIGLNAAAGFATPLERPQRPEATPQATAGDEDEHLEAHKEGICDPETCPHCEAEEAAELGLDETAPEAAE